MIPTNLAPLANHLWQSTLCAGVVWLLTLALRKNRAAVRYSLWLAASVKFLIPFSLLVSAGSQLGWRSAPVIAQPRFAALATEVSKPFAVAAGVSPMIPAPQGASQLPTILLGAWFCGVILGLIFWVRLLRQIRAVQRAATPLDLDLPIPVVFSASRLEPGVFGVLKPILILPSGITERLTPAQLQAVLTHELCHVRRRDNLTAAVHMVVETIFWFHPLVWWIRTKLVMERERACDEEVVKGVSSPQVYVEGILSVCKFYLESRVACVSGITGGDLKRRVHHIMSHTAEGRLSWAKKGLLAAVGAIALAGPLMMGLVSAPRGRAQSQNQQKEAPLAFDVASIKPSKSMTQDMSLNRTPGGGLEMVNGTLKTLVGFAYDLRDDQLSGGPVWFDSERYDIVAKAPPGTKISNPDTPMIVPADDPVRIRIRTLLADRFHLAVHHETKEMPILALVQDKSGAKLEAWKEGDLPGPHMRLDYTKLTCRKQSMQSFASVVLARVLGSNVVDKTGLTGEYNFVVTFQPESRTSKAGAVPQASEGPTFVEALREQLGLRLERQRGPVEILVIDHAEKPDPN
jgi:bla regulator protein blaR1